MDRNLSHLALHGGAAACPDGPPGWPPVDEDVRLALDRAWRDGDWGRYHGSYCERLCQALAEYHDVSHVQLCCSGTFAVELALRGLGIGPRDEVLLAGYDFPGNFRAVEAVGATPVLVDVHPDSWNLDVGRIEAALSPATKGVIASHLHGGMVPMRGLMEIAERRGLLVVEDACQAPGAAVEGRRAGTWGDVGVWSFGGSKLMTAGRGGAIYTRRADINQRAKIFCDRGNSAFPLSELQAAVLLPQLAKLDDRNRARQAAVERFLGRIGKAPGLRPLMNDVTETTAGYYKLGLQYRSDELADTPREDFLALVRAEGVALDAGFRGFARRGARRCRQEGTLDESKKAAAGAVLLHHPVLLAQSAAIDQAADGIVKVIKALST